MPARGAIARAAGRGQAHEGAADRLCKINVLRALYPLQHSQLKGRWARRIPLHSYDEALVAGRGEHISGLVRGLVTEEGERRPYGFDNIAPMHVLLLLLRALVGIERRHRDALL